MPAMLQRGGSAALGIVGWLVLASALAAAEYEQRQGSAVARLQGITVADARVMARLADEMVLTVTVEGHSPLHFDKSDREILDEQIKTIQTAGIWYRCEGETERTPLADGRERWRLTIHLDPLRTADVKLRLAPLSFSEGPEKKRHRVEWQPIALEITTEIVQPDLRELRDIAPPEELPPVPSWWLPWLIGLGLVLLGVGLILGGRELRRRLAGPEPAPPPDQWALGECARIEALGLPALGQVERYHTLLSNVLRRYFELRFQLPASQQTTAEFLAAVRRMPELTPAQQEQLREFLQCCDLAKFAQASATPEECQAVAALARMLVEQTAAVTETPRRQETTKNTKDTKTRTRDQGSQEIEQKQTKETKKD